MSNERAHHGWLDRLLEKAVLLASLMVIIVMLMVVVESTMLFNGEAMVWQKKEMRELQRVANQRYRNIWTDKRGETASKQMEEK